MAIIPLDLQRRFEQRWAARFARRASPVVPQGHQPESQKQQPAAPAEFKRKSPRVGPTGLKTAPAA